MIYFRTLKYSNWLLVIFDRKSLRRWELFCDGELFFWCVPTRKQGKIFFSLSPAFLCCVLMVFSFLTLSFVKRCLGWREPKRVRCAFFFISFAYKLFMMQICDKVFFLINVNSQDPERRRRENFRVHLHSEIIFWFCCLI